MFEDIPNCPKCGNNFAKHDGKICDVRTCWDEEGVKNLDEESGEITEQYSVDIINGIDPQDKEQTTKKVRTSTLKLRLDSHGDDDV